MTINKKHPIIILFVFIFFTFCTNNFEEINKNPNAATDEELGYDNLGFGSLLTQMQFQLFPSVTKDQNVDVNNYQKMFSLAGDVYSGHQGASNMFDNNGRNNTTYNMTPDWYSVAYDVAFQNYMTPWYNLHLKKDLSPTAFAVGQILKVYGMHRIVDMYGPIPYEDFVPASDTPFTSEEQIYNLFFEELNESVDILKEYIKNNPDAKPLREFDNIYQGDLNKWVLFANSLKLRLAIRIFYVDSAKSKMYAEEAIKDGVFISNEDNAMLKVDGVSTVNALYKICNEYNDTRLGATMEVYLKGYNDPRLSLLFEESELSAPDKYYGLRNGIVFNPVNYQKFSKLNIKSDTPIQLMTAAEVYFLRAEAALHGWYAGDNAQSLYEEGIQTAFLQPMGGAQAVAGDASEYIQGTTYPIQYVDPVTPGYNYRDPGIVTVKWDGTLDTEELLEKIITQKWIALYPNGQEAWSEFRRTGMPNVIPVAANYSGGSINTMQQIARLPYPNNLSSDYPSLYQTALTLLGGADTGGTKLWWDKKKYKPYQ